MDNGNLIEKYGLDDTAEITLRIPKKLMDALMAESKKYKRTSLKTLVVFGLWKYMEMMNPGLDGFQLQHGKETMSRNERAQDERIRFHAQEP